MNYDPMWPADLQGTRLGVRLEMADVGGQPRLVTVPYYLTTADKALAAKSTWARFDELKKLGKFNRSPDQQREYMELIVRAEA